MLVTSTPSLKKRKKLSSPSSTPAGKQKKKKRKSEKTSNPIPELILCAGELKTDSVKEETKQEISLEPVVNFKIEPLEEFKSEVMVKKKKKKRKLDIKVEQQIIAEPLPSDNQTNELVSDVTAKAENSSPVKSLVKTEPTELDSLFNSNIKQELENAGDAVDEHVCKKLSFKLTDPCIEKYHTTIHCAIPPFFINNIKNGIKSQLKTLHLKYLESENGVLLHYTSIRFKEQQARIVSISPELHFDISCLVIVFRPKLGAQLEGTVVKIGPGYVNCLVFGYFTAVVYDRFCTPVEVGSVIRFKLQFYQVTVHNDFILKGSPVT